jgi:signal transduction histidine kinase/pSer/pThr/pTyr-binding forkhead associated (FHA) protein
MVRGFFVPRLIVIRGPDVGTTYDLTTDVVTVGRDTSSTVHLHDTEASRRHAELRRTDSGDYRLLDVGSANGTLVNTRAIRDVQLQSGDHVQIGQSILVYTSGRVSSSSSRQLADQIQMIAAKDEERPSAIVKTIEETEGSRILARPDEISSPWLRTKLANLGVMYDASQAISHILELDPLLERIMELIFQSIEADRGCIMLQHPDTGELEPKAVRYREAVQHERRITISRTIMEHALREKQGVLVSDAARDDRFNTGQSIVRFGIHEAICVPMKGRHETLGVLYLDTQSTSHDAVVRNNPTGKFTEDHLALAIAIAHQAALAVEETRYHQALVQAERLAAVGQTIAALSHHIKNILQGLRSGSDLLKLGLSDNDRELLQKGWHIVEKNQAKIYDLVLDMLSYSKEREPVIEPTNINQVVQDVVELLRGRTTELNVQIQLRLDPKLPLAPADAEGLHRAILNVVGNALDAVADRTQPQLGIQTVMESDGQWVRIVIVDNGVGIAPDRQEEIFRPFVSSKGSRGTGLGLPVSRKIMREHGGDIILHSQSGKGTKFIMRLPMRSPMVQDVNATLTGLPPVRPELE